MNTIHIDLQGKSARVLFQPLPPSRPKPQLRQLTTTGVISPARVTNGINQKIEPGRLTAQELIEGDPELNIVAGGELLDLQTLTTAFFDPAAEAPAPVSDFKQIDIVYDPAGQEKERRPHVTRRSNLDDLQPVKIGKRLPMEQALTGFVFKQIYQIVHEDGVTKDFLHGIAADLQAKNEIAILGAGAKGNLPLVVRERGSPYRAFLYGETGSGADEGKYKLLLLLSDQELKRPEPAAGGGAE